MGKPLPAWVAAAVPRSSYVLLLPAGDAAREVHESSKPPFVTHYDLDLCLHRARAAVFSCEFLSVKFVGHFERGSRVRLCLCEQVGRRSKRAELRE